MNPFASLDAFRAHCGEPTMPLEHCSICSAIPRFCRRFVKGGDTQEDTVPPEVEKLEKDLGEWDRQGVVLRCPQCRRLYFHEYEYELIYGGAEDTYTYERYSTDDLFRTDWAIAQRTSLRVSWVIRDTFFPRYVFVRFYEKSGWFALDDQNAMIELGAESFEKLRAEAPPGGLEDSERALRYVDVVEKFLWPDDREVRYFGGIRFKYTLSDEERRAVEDLKQASRVEEPTADKQADRVVVTSWAIVDKSLVCRAVSVFPDGRVLREAVVIGSNLPLA